MLNSSFGNLDFFGSRGAIGPKRQARCNPRICIIVSEALFIYRWHIRENSATSKRSAFHFARFGLIFCRTCNQWISTLRAWGAWLVAGTARGFVWVQIRAERPRKQKKKMLQRCEWLLERKNIHQKLTPFGISDLFLEHLVWHVFAISFGMGWRSWLCCQGKKVFGWIVAFNKGVTFLVHLWLGTSLPPQNVDHLEFNELQSMIDWPDYMKSR